MHLARSKEVSSLVKGQMQPEKSYLLLQKYIDIQY